MEIHHQGHKLEDALKQTYPKLEGCGQKSDGESQLKKEMIKTIIDDIPEFIPQGILDTLASLQQS